MGHVILTPGIATRLGTGSAGDLPGGQVLTFVEVTGDSRCPANVQCVWAGEANVEFEWAVPGSTKRLTLTTGTGNESVDLGGGLRLRLIELSPQPTTAGSIAPSAYVGTVLIEQDVATTGAYGLVRVGPSCAVQRENDPCPDRPIAATLVFRNASGAEVARTLSDSAGFYSAPLPPGRYTIVRFTPGGATLPRGIPRDVEVLAGQWALADVFYDSGIR